MNRKYKYKKGDTVLCSWEQPILGKVLANEKCIVTKLNRSKNDISNYGEESYHLKLVEPFTFNGIVGENGYTCYEPMTTMITELIYMTEDSLGSKITSI